MSKKEANKNSILAKVAKRIIERGIDWPTCGGYIYQAERPTVRPEEPTDTESDKGNFCL